MYFPIFFYFSLPSRYYPLINIFIHKTNSFYYLDSHLFTTCFLTFSQPSISLTISWLSMMKWKYFSHHFFVHQNTFPSWVAFPSAPYHFAYYVYHSFQRIITSIVFICYVIHSQRLFQSRSSSSFNFFLRLFSPVYHHYFSSSVCLFSRLFFTEETIFIEFSISECYPLRIILMLDVFQF